MNVAPAYIPGRPAPRRVRAGAVDDQLTRYLEIDEEARRPGKSNFPMGLAAAVVFGLLIVLVVHLTFLALQP
jgi:hypothetical protein